MAGTIVVSMTNAQGGAAGVACVGTTLSGALAITSPSANVIAASGQVAAALPAWAQPGAVFTILNSAATAVSATIFPATPNGKINNGSAGAAVSVAQNKTAVFVNLDGADNWMAVLSA